MEILILEKLIPKECLGMRYDATLAKLFPDYSRAQLLKWLKLDYILLDGKSVKPTYKVKGIELVRLECPKEIKTHTLPQDIPIDIKYEDDYLLILNKPANLVVHPGAGNPDGTLVNALLHYNIGLESLPRAGIVHRLDKDTTGLMIVAKTLESYLALTNLMQERKVSRHYQAIVYGEVENNQTIETFMGRHPTNRTKMAVLGSGKAAVTHINVLAHYDYITHLNVKLETGRTHQIRVHLTHIGHPLIGDPTYQHKNTQKITQAQLNHTFDDIQRQALHAYKLEFIHPMTQKPILLTQPLPDDLLALLEKIKELSPNDHNAELESF